MTNKIFSKTVGKTTLFSTILAIILAAAIVVCALFGFNKDATLDDNKSLTVSLNTFAYNTTKEEVKKECEEVFGKLNVKYSIAGEMGGDECELVFVFDKSANVATMKTKIEERFTKKVADAEAEGATDKTWSGVLFSVSTATEDAQAVLAKHFVLRAAIAGALCAVLAFAYVAIRYQNPFVGLVAACSVAASMLLAGSFIVLTRTLVTTSVAAVIGMAGLMTAAMTVFTLGNIRSKQKEGAEISNEELVVSSIPVKETLWFGGALIVAMLLVGVLGKTAAAWFAVAAILAIVSSAAITLFFMPAMYFAVKNWLDKKPKKDVYVGAKTTSKKKLAKEKKLQEELNEVLAEDVAPVAEETPVLEEAQEEVAEPVVEEATEEVVEESVSEEAPEENTEA